MTLNHLELYKRMNRDSTYSMDYVVRSIDIKDNESVLRKAYFADIGVKPVQSGVEK